MCGNVGKRLNVNNFLDILVVEDSEDDARLLLHELKSGNRSLHFKRVDTAAGFLAAFKERCWDAVISDYVLPQFSGPEALKLLQKHGFDIPFIVVSGVYGEEKAVTMMKAGADDYILKSDLSRLAPALERELEAAGERRRRKRAEGAMQYLAAIVESSEDAIYGKDLNSKITSWNPGAERLFGYSAEEIIGCSTVRLFPLSRRDELLDILASIRRGENVSLPDTERRQKSGAVLPVSILISPIKNVDGEIIGASSIVRDLRAQKRAEQERQQLGYRLTQATQELRTLSGMLPICAACKSIRDDQGYWQQLETYLSQHSEIIFSHSLCPECLRKYERSFELGDAAQPGEAAG